ncbi:MAG: hypothetical protein J6Y52_06990 [Bacteroidales bacterium]|nr:hypothetical protein [Bacteroidales bacterium]
MRNRYPVFEYKAYHWKVEEAGLRLWFDFRMNDIEFHPTALVERRPFLDFQVPASELDRLVFDIGMIELVSYWKCACPPTVKVLCGSLTNEQVAFWKKLYWNGLGEFFYTNGIEETPEAFMVVESGVWKLDDLREQMLSTTHYPLPTHYLVPVGGGKDSVVTLELLRRAGKQIRPLIMNPRGATVECARVAGFPMEEVFVIRRTIDPTLLELNKQGYLNGHTPFSAMLAFYTRLASVLSSIPNVALSNESSANEATVLVRDQCGANENSWSYVNHQYSKSLEFENDFREYIEASTFNYFSFLRPLSELQIAMLFSRFTDYHDVFRSCNVGSKQDIWCGHCAKCLFAYIILSPFIEPERLNAIFGKSMLDDGTLRTEFLQLIGQAETKPFECVGTVDEVNTALSMTMERWYADRRPALLEGYRPVPVERRVRLHGLLPEGNLTEEERKILSQCIEKNS